MNKFTVVHPSMKFFEKTHFPSKMVHTLVFPTALTEEEQHLKKMFQLLRKLKNAKNLENDSAGAAAASNAPASCSGSSTAKMKPKKGLETAQVTTEQVKKLVKIGAMTIAKTEEKLTFKRSSQLDKKLKDNEFSKIRRPKVSTDSPNDEDLNPVSAGRTIYIRGYDLMEEPLTAGFSRFGKVCRVHIEDRRRSAFVDFETDSQALNAIREMDGNMINGVTLRVSMARRQNYDPKKRSTPWAMNENPKKPKFDFKEDREMIMYDDDDF